MSKMVERKEMLEVNARIEKLVDTKEIIINKIIEDIKAVPSDITVEFGLYLNNETWTVAQLDKMEMDMLFSGDDLIFTFSSTDSINKGYWINKIEEYIKNSECDKFNLTHNQLIVAILESDKDEIISALYSADFKNYMNQSRGEQIVLTIDINGNWNIYNLDKHTHIENETIILSTDEYYDEPSELWEYEAIINRLGVYDGVLEDENTMEIVKEYAINHGLEDKELLDVLDENLLDIEGIYKERYKEEYEERLDTDKRAIYEDWDSARYFENLLQEQIDNLNRISTIK